MDGPINGADTEQLPVELEQAQLSRTMADNVGHEVPRKYMLLGSRIAFDALQIATRTHNQIVAHVATVDPMAPFPTEIPAHVQDGIVATAVIRWFRKNSDQVGGWDQINVIMCAMRVAAMIGMLRVCGNEPWVKLWLKPLPAAPGQKGQIDLNAELPAACGRCKLEIVRDDQSGITGCMLDVPSLREQLDHAPRVLVP